MERERYDMDAEGWGRFHPGLKSLVRALLAPKETERVSAGEAKKCEWLREILG